MSTKGQVCVRYRTKSPKRCLEYGTKAEARAVGLFGPQEKPARRSFKPTKKSAVKKKTKYGKGWKRAAPKTAQERRKLFAACGPNAFLDPVNRAYPIMSKYASKAGHACEIDCRGLLAAKRRAAQVVSRYEKKGETAKAKRAQRIVKKADRMADTKSCTWAE